MFAYSCYHRNSSYHLKRQLFSSTGGGAIPPRCLSNLRSCTIDYNNKEEHSKMRALIQRVSHPVRKRKMTAFMDITNTQPAYAPQDTCLEQPNIVSRKRKMNNTTDITFTQPAHAPQDTCLEQPNIVSRKRKMNNTTDITFTQSACAPQGTCMKQSSDVSRKMQLDGTPLT